MNLFSKKLLMAGGFVFTLAGLLLFGLGQALLPSACHGCGSFIWFHGLMASWATALTGKHLAGWPARTWQ